MRKLNFAIIGCGLIGKRHCKHALKNGNLIAICDIDLEKLKTVANEYKIKNQYQKIEDLIQELKKHKYSIAIYDPFIKSAEIFGCQNIKKSEINYVVKLIQIVCQLLLKF